MKQDILTLKFVNINDVIDKFVQTFQPMSKLVVANGFIHLYIIENFYFRTGSEVAATILLELKDQRLLVVHITIAGGRDMLGISLGAQNSMLKKLRNFFVKLSE